MKGKKVASTLTIWGSIMTHNPKELRRLCDLTLSYIFRGDGHEHKVNPECVELIGGNMFELPQRLDDGSFYLNTCIEEFETSQSMHTGKGEKFYKHFIISLDEGESLTNKQWNEVCEEYMEALGYKNTNWVAAKHSDSSSEHIHILASRVKLEPGGALVSSHNDYEKGWNVMRNFERKFSLRQLENPADGFGHNYTKGQIKQAGSRKQAQAKDEAHNIRKTISALYKRYGKPSTMIEFVGLLGKADISVKARQNNDGSVTGMSYAYKDGPFLSGTKIKKTQLTFNALIKNGVSYQPNRDNYALGIFDEAPMYAHFQVKVTKKQVNRIHKQKAPVRLRDVRNSTYIDISMLNSKKQRGLAIAMANMMQILKMLFGNDDESIAFKQFLEEEWLSNLKQYGEVAYRSPHLNIYDTEDDFEILKSKLDEDTKNWREDEQSFITSESEFESEFDTGVSL